MLSKRATPSGGFWGLLCGTLSSILLWLVVKLHPAALAILALSSDAKPMAENLYRFIWSWLVCVVVTIMVSVFTTPKPASQLKGLVYGLTEIPDELKLPFYRRSWFYASLVGAVFLFLNIWFW
jgi:SSS family solute:Na+ symporter